jgi:hypothetical protein
MSPVLVNIGRNFSYRFVSILEYGLSFFFFFGFLFFGLRS